MSKANEVWQQAIVRLDFANEQLNRPDEDVMALALCQQARSIIGDLFSAYLLLHGKDISKAADLATLKHMAITINNIFEVINVDDMFCHPGRLHNEKGYCMDLNQVRTCIGIANNLKGLIAQAVPQMPFA